MKKQSVKAKKVQQVKPVDPVSDEAAVITPQPRKFRWRIVVISGSIAVLVIAAGSFIAFQYFQSAERTKKITISEVDVLVQKVGNHIELPEGETPTVATVTDTKQLAGQPFFTHAQNGDKVLIYQEANKAFLYSPLKNKVIEVGPVNTSQKPAVAGSSSTASRSAVPAPTIKPVRVAIYNATNITGLAAITEKQIKKHIADVVVTEKENASTAQEKTIVVDLAQKPVVATAIADIVGGTVVAAMPEGEIKPNTDILVIIGK
jgi:hypothetical protein